MSLLDLKGKLDQVWILAKGPTWYLCPEETPSKCEVWGLNSAYRDRPDQLDRLFIMHDIRTTMFHEDANLVPELNRLGIPVYTAGPYAVLENHRPFPAKEVINHFGVAYMLNVIAYMLATAIMVEPKEIHLYGCDFAFGVDINEKSCAEFWIGMAMGRGIKVVIPKSSHLLTPPEMRQQLYGYKVARWEPQGLWHIKPDRIRDKCASKYTLVPVDEER